MEKYILNKVINESLVMLWNDVYGLQMWGKVKLRKNNTCAEFKTNINKGSYAFRPYTNGYNRMNRISIIGMNSIINSCNKDAK